MSIIDIGVSASKLKEVLTEKQEFRKTNLPRIVTAEPEVNDSFDLNLEQETRHDVYPRAMLSLELSDGTQVDTASSR